KTRKLPSGDVSQTSTVGSGASWKCTSKKKNGKSCLSPFQRKEMTGSQARWKQQQVMQQNGTKGRDTAGHTYELVLKQPASQGRSQDLNSESSLHYADIQVCSRPQPHSAQRMKHQQSENRTEYATLRFPQATRRYDSKNGTLVAELRGSINPIRNCLVRFLGWDSAVPKHVQLVSPCLTGLWEINQQGGLGIHPIGQGWGGPGV
ncbi:putative protein C11orf52, partial [Galemys pyrenaicus]